MIDFLGIGSQKSATTWIYKNLICHPQVNFPAGKEVHFWDREILNGKTADDWLALFPKNNHIKQGEITPAYSFLNQALIQEIYNVCPRLRIFYSLRNPIDRAWSSALMALERSEMLVHEASDEWFVDHFHSEGSLQRGDYEKCLRNWWSVFQKEQIQLIFFEDITLKPRIVLQQLAIHIGIDPRFFDYQSNIELSQPINLGNKIPIRPSLLPVLHEIYDQKIERLQNLIRTDLKRWREPVDSQRVLVLTGMHRSGTSLTASLLERMGVHLGDQLLAGNETNVKGFFEDIDFLSFQENLLIESSPRNKPGWPSWGWLEDHKIDLSQLKSYVAAAKILLIHKQLNTRIWGWKDPRTTLLLDFWHQLLPDASYLLIYRFPWDVADSIQRLQAPPFTEHPDYGAMIWKVYNSRILEFYLNHSNQCILANVNMLMQQPERLLYLLKEKLSLPLEDINSADLKEFLSEMYEPELLQELNWKQEKVRQFQETYPECQTLLSALDFLADIPSTFTRFMQSERKPSEPCLLSIIIPCFNQGKFLLEALASIVNCVEAQNGFSYEIIIVNDGSTDPVSQQILACLREQGYTVIYQENQGISAARNTAIQRARGKYILPLDADNKIRSGLLQTSTDILDKYPDVGIVYSDVERFGQETGVYQIPEFDLCQLLLANYIDACAVFRKTVWEDCGGYAPMPNRLGYEDWEFWIHAAKRGWEFHHVPKVLFDYRVRPNSMSVDCKKPEHQQILYAYICNKHHELYTKHLAEIFSRQQFYIAGEYLNNQKSAAILSDVQTELASAKQEVNELRKQMEDWKKLLNHIQNLRHKLRKSHLQTQELEVELSNVESTLKKNDTYTGEAFSASE